MIFEGIPLSKSLPKYKCYKQVWALKIKSIDKEPLPAFTGLLCKGSVAFGTACGSCERCKWHQENGEARSFIITPEEDGYDSFKVDAAYMKKHEPKVGGYFVIYQDGYCSYSPAKAFEEGYKLMDKQGESE